MRVNTETALNAYRAQAAERKQRPKFRAQPTDTFEPYFEEIPPAEVVTDIAEATSAAAELVTEDRVLLNILERRYNNGQTGRLRELLSWNTIEARLLKNPAGLAALRVMEAAGGRPEPIGLDGEKVVFAELIPDISAAPGRIPMTHEEALIALRRISPDAQFMDRVDLQTLIDHGYKFAQGKDLATFCSTESTPHPNPAMGRSSYAKAIYVNGNGQVVEYDHYADFADPIYFRAKISI